MPDRGSNDADGSTVAVMAQARASTAATERWPPALGFSSEPVLLVLDFSVADTAVALGYGGSSGGVRA